MRFTEAPVPGVWVIDLDRHTDERGSFARTFDRDEFAARGLEAGIVQCSTSYSGRAGTLRGLHYQADPHGEPKLVRCTRGAAFDVVVDLRRDTVGQRGWFGVELSEENGRAVYIPIGVAHGFQTLRDDTELLYMMAREYVPDAASGVRWDDPAFGIDWPDAERRVMSERDRTYPDYAP